MNRRKTTSHEQERKRRKGTGRQRGKKTRKGASKLFRSVQSAIGDRGLPEPGYSAQFKTNAYSNGALKQEG